MSKNEDKSEDNKARLAKIRAGKRIIIIPTAKKVPLHQTGGQFAPQDSRSWSRFEVESLRRGYGWSEKTILKRQGLLKTDVHKPYDNIIEEIMVEGHAVLTRAPNVCEKCGRDTLAGEIVLGVVHGGYGTGGSDRYYVCNVCLRKEVDK